MYANRNYVILSLQSGVSIKVAEFTSGHYVPILKVPFRNNKGLPDDSSPWARKSRPAKNGERIERRS